MFNRLRAIWPKGYQGGSVEKIHQNGAYLKQAVRKSCLPTSKNSNLQPSDYRSIALPIELEKTSRMLKFDCLNTATCLFYDVDNNLIVMF